MTLVSAKGVDLGFAAIMSYLNNFFMLDFIQFYSVLKDLQGRQRDIDSLLENIGILDSAMAVASFREYLPIWCRPEFTPGPAVSLKADNLYHPLISSPVANSIAAEGGVLLTGSNASGKSTFLKTVAINAILAQSIDTCMATE